jgi:fusaric acid resistance family protein
MRTWRRVIARELRRLRKDSRAALLWSGRITAAAVASYVAGVLLFPGTHPLLAPLTAMLVVQVTPMSLLASGLDRVVAVVTGVSLAVVFATIAPLQWWSLGLLIFACITLGQLLRLRSNLVEVAISGMLVLGVGSLGAETAAWQRIAETLVGAFVGMATNLLFPPKVASADAGQAIDGLADSISDLMNRAADEMPGLVSAGGEVASAARSWLDDARRITHDIPRVGAALLHAEQGRRLNVRAVGTPNMGPGLRQGLEALEHSAVSIRGMLRAVADATSPSSWPDDDTSEDVLLGLAQTFREIAAALDAFGQLVRDDADPRKRTGADDVQRLREALEGLHEARARLDDLTLAGTEPQLQEMHGAVLLTVKRLLNEMDLDERMRRQLRLMPQPRPRLTRSRAEPGASPGGHEPDPDAETQRLTPRRPGHGDK